MIKTRDIANVILSITLIATFIAVFFFTYGSWIERIVVREQMDDIVKDLVGNIKILEPNVAFIAKNSVGNIKLPNMEKQDLMAKEHNNMLLKEASIILGTVLVIGILITFIMSKYFGFGFGKLLIYNLITLASVALTEFSFLTFFGKNFKSADPNVVKKAIIESLKKYSETP